MSFEDIKNNREVWVIAGTRPEVIKQVPVYLSLRDLLGVDCVKLVIITQHQELLQQALTSFGVNADIRVELERQDQTLHGLSAEILAKVGKLLGERKPRGVLVQGDTTAGAMTAVAAFYNHVAVWHNEAGLRSFDLGQPFPEEANRKWISAVSSLNFAPTSLAVDALLRENVSPKTIHLVGNSGIDSLLWALKQEVKSSILDLLHGQMKLQKKICLMTSHRRENSGAPVNAWYRSLASFLKKHPDVFMVLPIHPNNMALDAVENQLSEVQSNIHICEPLSYILTAHILKMSSFVVTDSGGIQEEAATLGIPVVVCRKLSERMEAVHAGLSRLVDPASDTLEEALGWAYQKQQASISNIYGDGQAGPKIAKLLKLHLESGH